MSLKYLFAYGTLKRGFGNNERLLGAEKFISTAETVELYPMIGEGMGFPYAFDVPGTGNILQGEVFEVQEKTWVALDRLEGYPNHYDRKLITVKLADGSYIEATIYVCKRPFRSFMPDAKLIANFVSPTWAQPSRSTSGSAASRR